MRPSVSYHITFNITLRTHCTIIILCTMAGTEMSLITMPIGTWKSAIIVFAYYKEYSFHLQYTILCLITRREETTFQILSCSLTSYWHRDVVRPGLLELLKSFMVVIMTLSTNIVSLCPSWSLISMIPHSFSQLSYIYTLFWINTWRMLHANQEALTLPRPVGDGGPRGTAPLPLFWPFFFIKSVW